ncbi:putative aminoacrylate peracid reductase RutC [Carnimonas sp. R-84981]|uniref:Rid family hydrolase n=1 Tax=Carnimonas bestiolae TaxID=3402172 RepID=UPI003EDB9FB0
MSIKRATQNTASAFSRQMRTDYNILISPIDDRYAIVESKSLISSGSSWEEAFGFSRAVEVDGWLYISKTGPHNPIGEIESDDISLQMKCILSKIKGILESSGYSIDDVIQSRLYLTEIEEWQQVARIHGQCFRDSRPAFTLLHVLPFPEKKMKAAIDIVAKKR